jgi:hypothetical protein
MPPPAPDVEPWLRFLRSDRPHRPGGCLRRVPAAAATGPRPHQLSREGTQSREIADPRLLGSSTAHGRPWEANAPGWRPRTTSNRRSMSADGRVSPLSQQRTA